MIQELYRHATALLEPLAPLLVERRLRRGREDPLRREERLGRSTVSRPAGPLLWIHAASVGESLSVLPLAEKLAGAHDTCVLFTTMTTSAAEALALRQPPGSIHQYIPFDTPGAVGRFFDRWRPNAALWVESELWPNLLMEAQHRHIPTALVNGRLSDRSFARWSRLPAFSRRLLGGFTTVLVPGDRQGRRFTALGAAPVVITGDLKATAGPPRADPEARARFKDAVAGRRVWLAASTHDGDERLACDIHLDLADTVDGLLTVIVPRHPARADDIAEEAAARGLTVARRSHADMPKPATDIFLGDSIGEMGLYLGLGDAVFMGKSMLQHGGHNPREAAWLGKPTVFGPHMQNFTDIARRLVAAGGALEACDAASLRRHVAGLLGDEQACRAMGERARALVEGDAAGVLDRAFAALQPLFGKEP